MLEGAHSVTEDRAKFWERGINKKSINLKNLSEQQIKDSYQAVRKECGRLNLILKSLREQVKECEQAMSECLDTKLAIEKILVKTKYIPLKSRSLSSRELEDRKMMELLAATDPEILAIMMEEAKKQNET